MLCVIARIHTAAREQLLALQHHALRMGISPRHLHGHITLATYTGPDEEGFVASCRELLNGLSAFSVRYEQVEALEATSIVVASPRRDGTLSAVQRRIALPWSDGLDAWTRPDVWKPHTTLFHKPEADLHAVAHTIQDIFQPFSALVEAIEFSRVHEDEYEIVDVIHLPQA